MLPQKTPTRKRICRIILITLVTLIAVIAMEEITFRLQNPRVYSTGPNAIWLRHSWIDMHRSEAQYAALAKRLRSMHITDVYFHAGPLNGDGSIPQAKLMGSADFIRHMKKFCPDVHFQPWLGQVAEFGGGGPLELRSPKVRARIVMTAHRFLDVGADGFHLDLEPVYTGDRDYIELLHNLHKLTKSHKTLLSIAAYKPEEFPGIDRISRLIAANPGYWTRGYFLEVANEVDQVAVMTYDSGIPLPGIYGRSVAWVTRWAKRNGVRYLYIGIPTYEVGSHAHFKRAENIRVAIHGLKLGLSGLGKSDRKGVGAAIFAEWTTSRSEERTFQNDWLGE